MSLHASGPIVTHVSVANDITPFHHSYILLSPLIYLFTPSNARSIQSILYALSAPVVYDADIAKEKNVSEHFAGRIPRNDGVRGGSIVRNCLSFR